MEGAQDGGEAAGTRRLETQTHLERLENDYQDGAGKPTVVKALLDSGSGVTSISEGLVERLKSEHPGFTLEQPFEGAARVRTAFGEQRMVARQTVPWSLTLLKPWGRVRFQLPFIILPVPGDLIVLGRVTLR